MNKTASKLAASVQRAKTQPSAPAQEGEKAETPAPAAAVATPSSSEAQARPARAPRVKAAETPEAASAVSSEDHHNGGQPVFPSRVWPD